MICEGELFAETEGGNSLFHSIILSTFTCKIQLTDDNWNLQGISRKDGAVIGSLG